MRFASAPPEINYRSQEVIVSYPGAEKTQKQRSGQLTDATIPAQSRIPGVNSVESCHAVTRMARIDPLARLRNS